MKKVRKQRKERPEKFKMNAMMALIKEGKTRREVAKLFDYSEQSISRWAIEHGLRKSNKISPVQSSESTIESNPMEKLKAIAAKKEDDGELILQIEMVRLRLDELRKSQYSFQKITEEEMNVQSNEIENMNEMISQSVQPKTFSLFWGLIKFNH